MYIQPLYYYNREVRWSRGIVLDGGWSHKHDVTGMKHCQILSYQSRFHIHIRLLLYLFNDTSFYYLEWKNIQIKPFGVILTTLFECFLIVIWRKHQTSWIQWRFMTQLLLSRCVFTFLQSRIRMSQSACPLNLDCIISTCTMWPHHLLNGSAKHRTLPAHPVFSYGGVCV